MASLEAVSCVRFRQAGKRTKDFLYIVSTKSNKCNSLIGYQGKKQHLYLDTTNPKCFKPVILMHELLHTLGFYHEHMSPIRDDYITVNWENIVPELKIFFNKVDKETFSDFGFGYDYDSVMHYGRSGFSANGLDTISPLNGNATIGQRMGLSLKDIGKLNAMYKCPMD